MNKWLIIGGLTGAAFLLWGGKTLMTSTRGVRNNNPLNIKRGNDWNGETDIPLDPVFESFKEPKYGFRAGAKLLRNYQSLYGLNTIRELINRFAPYSENNTQAYVAFVAKEMGVGENEPLDLSSDSTLAKLIHTMSKMESGNGAFSLTQAKAGVALV
ncbi:structural protein [Vibrio sp. HA2012]|uniref:structural protein n=1 Tax=Vibrio sp. HA2012 TaxID=1971595 RepID=UPI000C2C4F47|nr:structural protein [Vibrio sp. HA2012]PJC85707.1 structural protein [Vibrio sp. HA2012]